MENSDFLKYVEWLRSDDSSLYEDGFHSITGHVDEVLSELIELASSESDGFMRAKFVELIGESTHTIAIDFLMNELKSEHSEVRSWAYSSLNYSDDSVANATAREFAAKNPNEEFL